MLKLHWEHYSSPIIISLIIIPQWYWIPESDCSENADRFSISTPLTVIPAVIQSNHSFLYLSAITTYTLTLTSFLYNSSHYLYASIIQHFLQYSIDWSMIGTKSLNVKRKAGSWRKVCWHLALKCIYEMLKSDRKKGNRLLQWCMERKERSLPPAMRCSGARFLASLLWKDQKNDLTDVT